jgi:hypothetical protein
MKPFNIPSPRERHYWVVSPNVKNNPTTVAEWKKASILKQAAFIGWEPNSQKHLMGPKFAGLRKEGIMPDDVVLIARRYHGKPDVVGFGVVHGEYINIADLKDFKPPGNDDDSGSLRNLLSFVNYPEPPKDVPLIEVLPPRGAALRQIHPENGGAHKKVCDWMEKHLGNTDRKAIRKSKDERKLGLKSAVIVEPPVKHQSGYEYQPKSDVIKANQVEDELFRDYQHWLKKKGHQLRTIKYNRRLQCDGYEEERRNLIEAKASASRENIRMAVGQLLDYDFLGKREFSEPNKAILLPKKPDADIEKWLQYLHISIIWREGELFSDNKGGLFS